MWTLILITSLAGGPADRVLEDRLPTPTACVAEAARDVDRLPTGEMVSVFNCARDWTVPVAAFVPPLPGRKPVRADR